jgi:hypothetical protein
MSNRAEEKAMPLTLEPTKVGKFDGLQGFGTIKEIREIESSNVVPDDNIRIYFCNEITPSLKQFLLVLERKDLRADNVRTRIKREDVSYERLLFP